jgi:hypothetical protein
MVIKKASAFLIVLLTVTTTLADSDSKEEKTINFIVTPSIAYRYDVFKWAIPDDIFPQKKLSELVWKNRIIQPGIKIEIKPTPNQFTFLGQAKYGYILKNQSKSWDHDWDHTRDRTGNVTSKLVSTTKSQATGNILDLSAAAGYSVNLFKNNLFTFYIGYDYSDYRNKNYGDKQLAYKTNFSFSLGGLNQKYNFKTRSPWLGLSLNAPLNEKFTIVPTIKLYSFRYIGKGYWIHRGDLKQNPSFKQNAKGTGLGGDVDFAYKYSDNLDLTLNLETKRFKMKKGTEQLFYNSRAFGSERVASGKLLDLTHISSSVSAGLKYKL